MDLDGFTGEDGDPINPRKAGGREGGGGGYRPPGGPTIGPGGGFGGGFGGGGYFGAGAGMPGGEFFGVNTVRPRKRWVQGPNGPIAVSSSPMGTDTVPAMLTPGEFVVNREAAQMPGARGVLESLNGAGLAKRFSEGGMVEQEQETEPVDDRKELLMKLLRLLLDDGDEVQGFAWGGQVRPMRGVPGMASRGPQMPQAGLSGGQTAFGSGQRPGVAPAGFSPASFFSGAGQRAQQTMQPGGQTTGPSQWWPQGANPSGDPTIDLNEMSGSGWDRSRLLNELYKYANQFGQAGAFGPEGNQQLLEALRGEAMGNADALRRRAAMQADVSGLDPGQRAAYKMQTDLNTQGGVAQTLNAAKLGLLQNQQQFGQNLLSSLGQFNMQDWLAERQGDISKRYAPDGPSGWETIAGLGGQALGGWAGGGFKTPWGKGG